MATPLESLENHGANAELIELNTVEEIPHLRPGATRLHSKIYDKMIFDSLVVNKESNVLVVALHGATNRAQTTLPRFEWLRTLLQIPVSSLYISDPTLHLDPNIQLTWYTGTPEIDIHLEIARHIRAAANILKIQTVIITGSSGGGFASLQISKHLEGSIAIAFNAQTDIPSYRVGNSKSVVDYYRRTVWPESDHDSAVWYKNNADRLSAIHAYRKKRSNTVYIVQNVEEPHYESHYLPFIEATKGSGNHIVGLTNQEGPIHNPPKRATFISILSKVIGNETHESFKPVKKELSAPQEMPLLLSYRGDTSTYDDLMDTRIERYRDLSDVALDLERPVRLIIQNEPSQIPIDALWIPREDSTRLLVGFHGSENRSLASLPDFQFARSFLSRSESLLFISDSTLLQGERLPLGWLTGNRQTHLAGKVAELIKNIKSNRQIDTTTLVGHSAGGFKAMMVGTMVENSRAISVNGQTVIGIHQPWTLTLLRESAFPQYTSNEEMIEAHPERFDLRVALERRVRNSTFTYFVHEGDRNSITDYPHYPLLYSKYNLEASGGRTQAGDALVPCTWESSNPNAHALPGTILPFIDLVLDSNFRGEEIKHEVNPLWI